MDNVHVSSVFPLFLENHLLKVNEILGLTFFRQKKDFEGFKTAFFRLRWLRFVIDGLFTTPVYSLRRGRFVNSAFPNKKKLAPNSKFIYDKQNWKQMFAEILRFKWIGERIHEDDVLRRGTEPQFLAALHAKNDTTNLFGYKLGDSTENIKALLFFSGKETIQALNGSI